MPLNFVTIAGLDVEVQSIRRLTPVGIGELTRAYDRTLRSSRHATTKLEWSVTTRPYTVAEQAALRAACAFGTTVAVGGPAIVAAGTLSCKIEEGESDYIPDLTDATNGFQAPLALTIRQV